MWNWVTKEKASKWPEGISVIAFVPGSEFRYDRIEVQTYFRPDWIWTWVDDALFCKVELPKENKK